MGGMALALYSVTRAREGKAAAPTTGTGCCFDTMLSRFRYAQFFQDSGHWAEFGKAVLKKIQPNKSGKEEPVLMDEKRVIPTIHAKSHGEKDKKSSNSVYPVCNNHLYILVNGLRKYPI